MRVAKFRAGIIYERDPAIDFRGGVVARNIDDVIGAPGNISGEIRGFHFLMSGAAVREQSTAKLGVLYKFAGTLGKR